MKNRSRAERPSGEETLLVGGVSDAGVSGFAAVLASAPMQEARTLRNARRARLREEALATLGSEAALWEPTPEEALLVAACQPLIVEVPIVGGTMETLEGWYGGGYDGVPVAVREALLAAIPVTEIAAAWCEFGVWERLYAMREAFWGDYEHPVAIRARLAQIERLLDTLPARSMRGLRARLDWMAHLAEQESHRGRIEEGRLVAQFRDDVERLGARVRETRTPPRQDEHAESEEPKGSPSGDKPQENRTR